MLSAQSTHHAINSSLHRCVTHFDDLIGTMNRPDNTDRPLPQPTSDARAMREDLDVSGYCDLVVVCCKNGILVPMLYIFRTDTVYILCTLFIH